MFIKFDNYECIEDTDQIVGYDHRYVLENKYDNSRFIIFDKKGKYIIGNKYYIIISDKGEFNSHKYDNITGINTRRNSAHGFILSGQQRDKFFYYYGNNKDVLELEDKFVFLSNPMNN